ncbi:MAG: TFIIB-type zinc ribbon-containing protein [Clostridiales bacterium]|nr:TFIIB-type zinc ribbon-containing protein [Clostridiales bacterium]
MVKHYKCSNCGADMEFDTASGMLKCSSCGRMDSIEQMAGQDELPGGAQVSYNMDEDDKKAAESAYEYDYENSSDDDEPSRHITFREGEAKEYNCKNCGAVLITDIQTTATKCNYCGAGIVISERLSGILAPECVIPFTISKEQAQEAFKKWCRKGLLTPNDFRVADRIKDITGLYVPFWLYDLNGKGEVEATCTKVRTYSSGDWIYKETKYYHVYRKVDLNYLRVPCDASKKMDDTMMDRLEPYNYNNLKDFQMPYLAGYIAEKYDYDDDDLLPRVKNRVHSYVDSYIRSTISGYSSVHYNRKDIRIIKKRSDYALFPVWMVCYDFRQAEHTFAMNGQTGKIVGKPPISAAKVAAWFFGISGGTFLLFRIITSILGGGFLWF